MENDKNFWNNRYLENNTAWDLGTVSLPIKNYIDQLTDKNAEILIPGCGNTYEAAYLLENGFNNVTVIDIAPVLVENLKEKFKDKNIKIICGDFFNHNGQYDLIIEQTFFCAINRSLRSDYAKKMNELIKQGGKLAGVLFKTEFEKEGPPFGGSKPEYEKYFTEYFDIKYLDDCYNSAAPRAGNELFMLLIRK